MNVRETSLVLDIPEISKLNKVTSQVRTREIPYEIEVFKSTDPLISKLGVTLKRVDNNIEIENWANPMRAKFKLLSYDDSNNEIEDLCDPYSYDYVCEYGTSSLIDWNDLFASKNKYVKNDTIKLKIELELTDSDGENKAIASVTNQLPHCDEVCMIHKNLRISNIHNLIAVRSPEFQFQQLSWYFTIYKTQSDYLSIHLIRRQFVFSKPFEVSMHMTLIIISSKPKGNIHKSLPRTTNSQSLFVGEIISWDELKKPENGFVHDNCINIQIVTKS